MYYFEFICCIDCKCQPKLVGYTLGETCSQWSTDLCKIVLAQDLGLEILKHSAFRIYILQHDSGHMEETEPKEFFQMICYITCSAYPNKSIPTAGPNLYLSLYSSLATVPHIIMLYLMNDSINEWRDREREYPLPPCLHY